MPQLCFPLNFRKLELKFRIKIRGERMDLSPGFVFEFSKIEWKNEFWHQNRLGFFLVKRSKTIWSRLFIHVDLGGLAELTVRDLLSVLLVRQWGPDLFYRAARACFFRVHKKLVAHLSSELQSIEILKKLRNHRFFHQKSSFEFVEGLYSFIWATNILFCPFFKARADLFNPV